MNSYIEILKIATTMVVAEDFPYLQIPTDDLIALVKEIEELEKEAAAGWSDQPNWNELIK